MKFFKFSKLPFFHFSDFFPFIAVDIGSSHIRVGKLSRGKFRYYQHAATLAVESKTKKIIAFGDDAQEMSQRVKETIEILYPIKDGVVYDSEQAQILIKLVLEKHHFFSPWGGTTYMVSVPTKATSVEKKLIQDVLFTLGAKAVFTISQALAASIGAGVPIADASGSFLFHIGASRAEAVVISLGSIISCEDSTSGGEAVMQEILRWFKKEESLIISQETAVDLLQVLSSEGKMQQSITIIGQDLYQHNPREITFQVERLQAVIQKFMLGWSDQFKKLLSTIPPELTTDIIDKGVLLSGRMSTLGGFTEYLVKALGVPVSVVEEPDTAVIRGIGTALEHLEEFKKSLGYTE